MTSLDEKTRRQGARLDPVGRLAFRVRGDRWTGARLVLQTLQRDARRARTED